MSFDIKFILKRAITLAMIFTISAFITHFVLKYLVYKGVIFSEYKILYYNESNANPIWVYDDKEMRCLSFERPSVNMIKQTCIFRDKPHIVVLPYHKMILSAFYLNPEPKKILVLGLGGGAIPIYLNHMTKNQAIIDVIEINQTVSDIAKKYFFLDNHKQINIIVADAKKYINDLEHKETYDLIIVDLFDNLYIPQGILSPEFIKNAKESLTENGVIAFNTFYDSNHYKKESRLFKGLLGEFYNVYGNGGNRIIIANKNKLKSMGEIKENTLLYKDILESVGISNEEALSYFEQPS